MDDKKKQDLFDAWGVANCECIGYYHYDNKNGVYLVDDLRKPNFDNIPYYPGDKSKRPIQIKSSRPIGSIKTNDYYLFTWKLSHKNNDNSYEISIDSSNPPKPIEPKWFINMLFNDRHNDRSKNFASATNFLDTLSKQLSAKDSTFIYELLQNANDYPVEGNKVDVEFNITDKYLLFLHSGDKFNVRNISGICGINEKEKNANKKTIGYKGIGFKTVFLNNHYVYIKTGEYSFRFDEKAEKIKRLEAPWPILPVWTEHNEIEPEVNAVFDGADKKFQVKIALRPESKSLLHDGKNNYEKLFKDVFADSNVILFIPNINSVRVVINGQEKLSCFRNDDEWIVCDYTKDIPFELKEKINQTVNKGNSRIPEKYMDFECTKVSFACKRESTRIIPINKATLYCYLPTNASWGFPFLMNTDMIPKGDRNDIETEVKLVDEETNFNEELAAIAGAMLFSWIKDLLTSKKYDLCSVFSLIPDFKKCKREHDLYENYIEHFEHEFDECVYNGNIVPINNGLVNVKCVICDATGLSSSGIMTDDEFLKFIDKEDYCLPLSCLRNDNNFNGFLNRYVDDAQKFDEKNLPDLIANKDFQEWLKVQDNNNKFLEFLLKKDYLKDLLDEKIFLEADYELYKASDLFYDIDKYLTDLKSFKSYIHYLSPATRQYFKGNRKWKEKTKAVFAEFNCDKFVNNTLLHPSNIDDVKDILNDKNTSILFFKFLAKNVRFTANYLSLPFISDNDEVVDDFKKNFIFLDSSKKGHDVFAMAWLSSVDVAFISPDYDQNTIKYFKDNFKVLEFSDKIVVEDIILSENFHDVIERDINEDFEISKAFVDYCYANKDMFKVGALHSYSLGVYDGDDKYQWCLTEDNIFFHSKMYDQYALKDWLNVDWMYALNESYFDNIANKEDFKGFLKSKFDVKELTEEKFYTLVVKKNLSSIFNNTSGPNDSDGKKNIDFIRYLDDNYDLIFKTHKDYDRFNNFIPVSDETQDLSLEDEVYVYNKDLAEILNYDWFPNNIVYLCNKEYGDSPALKRMGCKEYKFGQFYNDVIIKEFDSINDCIDNKEKSVSFHSFIIGNLRLLTPDQQSEMVNATIFLYGNDEASPSAGGHKILSAKAKELFDMGIVEFSDLDIIDPDYKTEENLEYWEKRLGNTKFTVKDFFAWLKDNTKTICETLQDEKLNIAFWHWLKDNANENDLCNLPLLPILLKDGSIEVSTAVYFPDEYMDAGVESFISKFDPDAMFISPSYIRKEDGTDVWQSFWLKVGIKYEIVDILTETIIPNLSNIEEEGLPKLIAENREALEKIYQNKLVSQLTNLRIKGNDEIFYRINETIYINCEKDEPFPYIKLPNQISFSTVEERRLIKDIIDEVKGNCVETLSEWQQQKLDYYLEMQSDGCVLVRDFHYRFINDLSVNRKEDKDRLKSLERIEKILLLNKDNEFCEANTLAMGSVYNPFFDFEGCGIDSIDYVSDTYIYNCQEHPGELFKVMKVQYDFKEKDIELLENRQCAKYFWNEYLNTKSANISLVKEIISNHKLDNIPCIPTKDYMRTPNELYYDEEVRNYVKNIEDWENKIPLKDISVFKFSDGSTIFDGLPFKHSLDFLDALYALVTISSKEKRTKLLKWIIDDYDESYDAKIEEYRNDEHALWKNKRNEPKQIKTLYALEYSDKTLKIFDNNERIIDSTYFPLGDSFKKACDILKIKVITKEDLITIPVDANVYNEKDNVLKLFALVIAGEIGDVNGWQDLYNGYKEKLNELTLYNCKSIKIKYSEDESINQQLGKFYNESNNFYFVNSLDDKKVFLLFVEAYMDFLDIDTKDIRMDRVIEILDSRDSAVNVIKEKISLMQDDTFMGTMKELIPGFKGPRIPPHYDSEEREGRYTPSFTTRKDDKHYGKSRGGEYEGENVDEGEYESENVDEGEYEGEYESENVDEGEYEGEYERENVEGLPPIPPSKRTSNHYSNPDRGGYMGSENYQPIGDTPIIPRSRKSVKRFTYEEIERLRSHGTPLELKSLPPTTEEREILGQCGISSEQIADANYLAQYRLYRYLEEKGEAPAETMEEFVKNAKDVSLHKLKNGKSIHACSAARGVMYISPSIWNKVIDENCRICFYRDGQGSDFHFIDSSEDFLQLVEKDDVVIKITGKEKIDVVKALYTGLLKNVKGTAYTLIRVTSHTNMDNVFAHYVGAMAEPDDGNDSNEY